MPNNPIPLNFPGNSQGFFSAMSNAWWQQRVTLTKGGTTLTVFKGTGEGTPMADLDGNTTYAFNSAASSVQIWAYFEYSTDDGNTWQAASIRSNQVVLNNGTISATVVTSEDSSDNDNNDSFLLMLSGMQSSARTKEINAAREAAGTTNDKLSQSA